ncbi:hypothetical protein G6L12_08350 [Agrobacterium rhizogenes]|nr:hypothetical protein [Rhizobium rhizogenes]NTF74483.1 hypothetical protein [Rhizobium rhizogenes]
MQLNVIKDWFVYRAALEGDHEIGAGMHPCNCIGPQHGQPVCPCAMRSVTIENGRYVDRRDLGPAPSASGGSRINKGEDA